MIQSKNRGGWFGASDTAEIMGNWQTRTFEKWWLEKCGIPRMNFNTKSMLTGTFLEHRILDHLGIQKRDRQIRFSPFRLRVNLDGEDPYEISEVKTYSADHFKVSKAYWQQCQVEMYATGLWFRRRKQCRIVAYRVLPEDYDNYFLPIDDMRLSYYRIPYDKHWVRHEYLPRLKYLAMCLKKGAWPDVQNIRPV